MWATLAGQSLTVRSSPLGSDTAAIHCPQGMGGHAQRGSAGKPKNVRLKVWGAEEIYFVAGPAGEITTKGHKIKQNR